MVIRAGTDTATDVSSKLSLGENWNASKDPTGWWMTEKMDGIRALWDGSQMYSRGGKELTLPSWFTSDLPSSVQLDGELWMGRQTFEQLNTLMNSNQMDHPDWHKVRYCLFDLPSSEERYEARMDALRQMALPKHVEVVQARLCEGADHVRIFLDSVTAAKGEGLVLREPNSLYSPGRTSSILKVKVSKHFA